MKDQRGFTLIEVLVVILIIGVLATVVLVALGDSKKRANDKKVAAQLKAMIPQALLYTGTNVTGSFSAIGNNNPSGALDATTLNGDTSNTGNMFNYSGSLNRNSLYKLIKGLPKGTTVIFAKGIGNQTNAAGQWALAATTTTGSVCVDYRQKIVTKEHPPVVAAVTNSGTPSLQQYWPNVQNPSGTGQNLLRANCN